MSSDEYRASVLRDLRFLLNTRTHWPDHPLRVRLETDGSPPSSKDRQNPALADFPHALASVVCYGMPDMTGLLEFAANPGGVSRMVREAITKFEPRIDPDSLEVSLLDAKAEAGDRPERAWRPGERRFLVEADLLARPRPEHFIFVLKADLASSKMDVVS